MSPIGELQLLHRCQNNTGNILLFQSVLANTVALRPRTGADVTCVSEKEEAKKQGNGEGG